MKGLSKTKMFQVEWLLEKSTEEQLIFIKKGIDERLNTIRRKREQVALKSFDGWVKNE